MGCYCNQSPCSCNGIAYGPCNPSFPQTCETLGVTPAAVRVLVEDTSNCQRCIAAPSVNTVLGYNSATGYVGWVDGSSSIPLELPNLQSVTGVPVNGLVGIESNGTIVEVLPETTSGEPDIMVSGNGAAPWTPTPRSTIFGTGLGLPYRPQASPNKMTFLGAGAQGQIVSANSSGDPVWSTPTQGSIGAANLRVTYNSTTQKTISADFLTVYSPSGCYQLSNVSQTVNTNLGVALNGADATVSQNTVYFLYVIYNPTTNTQSAVISTNSSAPTLTNAVFSGFTAYRKIGVACTLSGSTSWDMSQQIGNVCTWGNISGPVGGPASNILFPASNYFTASITSAWITGIPVAGQISELLCSMASGGYIASTNTAIVGATVEAYPQAQPAPFIGFYIQVPNVNSVYGIPQSQTSWIPWIPGSGASSLYVGATITIGGGGSFATNGVFICVSGYRWNFI